MSDQNAANDVIVIHPPDPERTLATANNAVLQAPGQAPEVAEREHAAPVVTAVPVAPGERALGLDAFRGLLMLAMVFAFTIPGTAGMPAWMYHMQFPPPAERFELIAGLAWRDFVFPSFLFTLAAAIPLANTKYLAGGMPYPAIIWKAVKRAAVLFAFALLIGHTNPFWTNNYTRLGNVFAIIGFLACWPLLLSRRSDWDAGRFRIFRSVGLAAAALVLLLLPLAYDASFSLARKDNIIHALAFAGLVGVPIWLATRHNVTLRMVIVMAIVALKLAAGYPGWLQEIWVLRSWFLESWFVELLIIVLPGTVAGEMVVKWIQTPPEQTASAWDRARLAAVATIAALVTPVLLIGLYTRHIGETTVAVAGLAALGTAFVHQPFTYRDRILTRMFHWGALLLVLGMLLEPFEGGIKKDPQTLSFLVLMTGYCFMSLVAIIIASDLSKRGRSLMTPFALIGRNPLLIYVVFTLFISHILYLAGVGSLGTLEPLTALLRAILLTSVTGVLVLIASRKGIYWRA